MIYEFQMGGYEGVETYLLLNEKKDYSEEEFHELCADLYIEEMDKELEEMYEHYNNDPERIEDFSYMYKQAEHNYTNVLNRLIDEYHFTEIKSNIKFTIFEYFSFDKEKYDREETLTREGILLRKKYKLYERKQKLKRIIKE